MVPSVLETSIRSVPTKVERENDRDQIGIATAPAKNLHTTIPYILPLYPSLFLAGRWVRSGA